MMMLVPGGGHMTYEYNLTWNWHFLDALHFNWPIKRHLKVPVGGTTALTGKGYPHCKTDPLLFLLKFEYLQCLVNQMEQEVIITSA